MTRNACRCLAWPPTTLAALFAALPGNEQHGHTFELGLRVARF